MTTVDAARSYVALGWYPIPLRPRSKACRDDDWMTRIYRPEEFKPNENVGLRLVPAGDRRDVKLVAVDLDCPEAVALYPDFLPPGPSWGRSSKACSQILYDSGLEKTIAIRDDARTILEVRVDHQSMAPPSVWTCGPECPVRLGRGACDVCGMGEELSWLNGGPSAAPKVAPVDLVRAARLLATAVIVKRYYAEPGARHDWCLALTGSLRQLGLNEGEATRVLTSAGSLAGDHKMTERIVELRGTYAKTADGKIAGFGKLAEIAGEALGTSLKRAWGFVDQKAGRRGAEVASEPEVVLTAIEQLEVRLSRDTFSNRLLATSSGTTRVVDDEVADRLWLELQTRFGLRVARQNFDVIVRDAARRNPFHPVKDWLESLKWDGVPRIDTWLRTYGEAADGPYFRAVGAIVLVAAVRRVRQPGVKFDELLVLEGVQGCGKSSALRALCPRDEWFSDDLPLGVSSKEVIERTTGKWIVEAAELVNARAALVEGLKGMLSRQVDGPVRLAYDRYAVEVPRQFVIVGTTNNYQYLQDSTGNRRFWPVRVKRFALAELARDRDQLWAEAVVREASGASIRLDPTLYGDATFQQGRREIEDPWENALLNKWGPEGYQRISYDEVWDVLSVPINQRDRFMNNRIASVMQKLGYRRNVAVRNRENRIVKGWGRDDKQRDLKLSVDPTGDDDVREET